MYLDFQEQVGWGTWLQGHRAVKPQCSKRKKVGNWHVLGQLGLELWSNKEFEKFQMNFSTSDPLRLVTTLQLWTSRQDVHEGRESDWMSFEKRQISSSSACPLSLAWRILSGVPKYFNNLVFFGQLQRHNYFSPGTNRQTPLRAWACVKYPECKDRKVFNSVSAYFVYCVMLHWFLLILPHEHIRGNILTVLSWPNINHLDSLFIKCVLGSSQICWILRRCDKRWYHC